MITVKEISAKETYPFLLNIHYAKRIPSITYSYGLFDNSELIGVVTYGTPASAPLRRGIAGDKNISNVIELNRLCLKYNRKNEASKLVGKSLRMLPWGKIVISFADTSQNHLGIVYQACNFLYAGLSAKRTDYKVKGLEHIHSITLADQFRNHPNRTEALKQHYGDLFYYQDRPRKHRYIYVTGRGKLKENLIKEIKYNIIPYPKDDI